MIDDVHLQFMTAVAEGRHLKLNVVQELADGRIYTGRQALEVKLVDRLGNLEDAIDEAAELAGITDKPNVVYPPKEKRSFVEYFVNETISQVRQGLHEYSAGGLQFLWPGVE